MLASHLTPPPCHCVETGSVTTPTRHLVDVPNQILLLMCSLRLETTVVLFANPSTHVGTMHMLRGYSKFTVPA
jgi:hypothetical protein